MFDFDELSGEEAEEAKENLPVTSPVPTSPGEVGQRRPVVVRHAIHGWELLIWMPQYSSFSDLKRALAKRFLQDANASFAGQLVRKEGGVYCSYKDTADLGDLREVLLAGFEPAEAPKQREEFVFEEIAKKAASDVANPEGSLAKFISLQKALRAGFAEDSFQDELHKLKEQCDRGELRKTKFLEQRQKLFLTVQSQVLPKFGYEGTAVGVYKMMGDMKPYVQEPDFVLLADEINALLGIDYSPPDTWTALSDSCQKLNDDKEVRRFAPAARRQEPRRNEFRPPLGLLGPVGVPSLMSGKPMLLPDSILQGPP